MGAKDHCTGRAAGDDRAASVCSPERRAHPAVEERIEQVARLAARKVDQVGLADGRDGCRVARVLRTADEDRLDLRAECREVRLPLRGPAAEGFLAIRP